MATGKEIEKLGKKVAETITTHSKALKDLSAIEQKISVQGAIASSGDVTRMGQSAIELGKLIPKLAPAQKKVADAQKAMISANKALAAAA